MSLENLVFEPYCLLPLPQKATHAAPIRAQAIPLILEERSIIADPQTETGKTASFTLPALQRLTGKAPDIALSGYAKRNGNF